MAAEGANTAILQGFLWKGLQVLWLIDAKSLASERPVSSGRVQDPAGVPQVQVCLWPISGPMAGPAIQLVPVSIWRGQQWTEAQAYFIK